MTTNILKYTNVGTVTTTEQDNKLLNVVTEGEAYLVKSYFGIEIDEKDIEVIEIEMY